MNEFIKQFDSTYKVISKPVSNGIYVSKIALFLVVFK